MTPLIDTHCHIDAKPFDADRAAVIARAQAAGVGHMVVIGCSAGPEITQRAVTLAETSSALYAACGIHPHDAGDATEASFEALKGFWGHPKVRAAGEMGLDYYYKHSPPGVQRRVFARQIRMAKDFGQPIVVHSRDAYEDTLAILRDEGASEIGAIIHCFTYGLEEGQAFLDEGFLLSIPGVVTFKNAEALQNAVASLPVERMVVETDCPYLAPLPHRGKRNEPAYVVKVAEKIAALKPRVTFEDVARITTRNAENFFRIGGPGDPRIAYRIRNSVYLNVTLRCTIHCVFCGKYKDFTVKGHNLRIPREPTIDELRTALAAELDARGPATEIVFCGYGEPLLRLDVVKQFARELRAQGHRVRVNTDGLASLVHGRDVAAELAGIADELSVSLNAPDAALYARICPSRYGETAYEHVKAFIRAARAHVPVVVATAVGLPEVDAQACERVATQELGVPFRYRPYNDIG